MVAGVRHDNMAVLGDGQSLGSVQRVRRSVDVGQEGPLLVKHLQIKKSEKDKREYW